MTLWTRVGYEPMTPMLTRALHSLGYRIKVRKLGFDSYSERVSDSATRVQIGANTWTADYPTASTFLDLFTCRSFVPHSTRNGNLSQFCDPGADDLMRRASELATDPRAADARWAKAEQRVLAAVPAIPVLNPVHTDLVSTRVRNDQYHPEWGLLLDQVSVR